RWSSAGVEICDSNFLVELLNHRDVIAWLGEAHAHRVDRDMRRAEALPGLELLAPLIARDLVQGHAPLQAEPGRIAAGLAGVGANPLDDFSALCGGAELGHPAVGEAGGPAKGRVRRSTEPERDWPLHRQWVDPGCRDGVPATLVVDHLVGPE